MENENQIKPDINMARNKNIETLAGDMVEVIKKNRDGEIRKIILDQEEKETEIKNLSPQSRRNKFFLIGSGILIVLAVISLVVYFSVLLKKETVQGSKQFRPIIFTEKTTFADITGLEKDFVTKSVFKEATRATLESGQVEAVYVSANKKVVGFKEFLSSMKANVFPDGNAISDNFLLGLSAPVHTSNSASSVDIFVLFRADLFSNSFKSMRQWESKMFFDLHDLFGFELNKDTSFLLNKNFEDSIVQNKNARILFDNEKKIVLMYVFVDNDFVLITNSEESTREVILRLKASKVGK